MPHSKKECRIYDDMIPHWRTPKPDRVKASFQVKKLHYQWAKLDLEMEREIQ
jgi:hypothetical protein